jgi:hypothetical protein
MATEEEHREEWIGLYEVTSADWDGAGADFGLYSPKCLEGVFSGVRQLFIPNSSLVATRRSIATLTHIFD